MPKRKAKYKILEEQQEKEKATIKIHICTSCGDGTEVTSTRGTFHCPNCGWKNKV